MEMLVMLRVEIARKTLRTSLILLAVGYPTQSWAKSASDFFPICSAPGAGSGRTLTVDPASPRPGGYTDIASALKAARPGDTIGLTSGDYGTLNLSGMNQSFITIAAAPGQTPKFTKLSIGQGNNRASHWRLSGLTISSMRDQALSKKVASQLVVLGNSDNIILERNVIQSRAGTFDGRPESSGQDTGLSSGIYAAQASCISIVENRISNIWDGIQIGGDQNGNNGKYFLVSGNVIENYAGDGIDHFGSHIRIENNRIVDAHGVCGNKCVHNDGIQGWNFNNRPGLINTDIVINDNEIVQQTRPNLVLAADALQGITIFDGNWEGVRISNNIVIVSAWHGITVFGARDVSIFNNTVIPANPKRSTWIMYGPGKNTAAAPPGSAIVRNNIARDIGTGGRLPADVGAVLDHNIKVRNFDDFADFFVKFDPENFTYDLHLSRRSDARGEGSSDGAPATDIEGSPRGPKMDIGAYAYRDK
jgi:hypothetical protein